MTKTPPKRARKRPAKKAARKKPARRVPASELVPVAPQDWPPSLTAGAAKKLFDNVEEGLTIRAAAKKARLRAASVYQWKRRHAKFAERLAEAEDIGHEMMLDELVDISDSAHCRDSAAGAKERREARMEHLRGKAPNRFHRSPFRPGDAENPDGYLVGVVLVPPRAPVKEAIEGEARVIKAEHKPQRAGNLRLGSAK